MTSFRSNRIWIENWIEKQYAFKQKLSKILQVSCYFLAVVERNGFLFCFWSQWLTRNTIISFLYRNELKSRHQKRISLLCARWNWTSCPLPIMASYRQLYRGTVPLYLSLLQEFLPIFQATRPSMKTTDAADDKIFSQVWNNKLIPLSLIVKDYWYSTVPTWIRIYTRAT
jgi:hypothetical protein